ncbi:MAG: cytochrome c oxidase subunit 3 family protein [Planctomycetota bacterium]|nr:MAG: cytochrome c oxidase subunit 3 family protein [Planctomycetota bacterium]
MTESSSTSLREASADHETHPAFLAHHFETPRQQFEAGKLGTWIFLISEILFFSGLFCAYTVYRSNHPEIFIYAHQFLDKNLGALNTVVLIFSSFTMALAVRYAQLGKQKALVACLAITLACAFVFLGVKYVEYQQKWKHGLLWASRYHPTVHAGEGHEASPDTAEDHVTPPAADEATEPEMSDAEGPRNAGIFFSIYFVMTGLHGLHVLGGMGAITWLLVRASKGVFGPEYFGPVDYVGLYWHLVDLIWIFLFPLLYLIH